MVLCYYVFYILINGIVHYLCVGLWLNQNYAQAYIIMKVIYYVPLLRYYIFKCIRLFST